MGGIHEVLPRIAAAEFADASVITADFKNNVPEHARIQPGRIYAVRLTEQNKDGDTIQRAYYATLQSVSKRKSDDTSTNESMYYNMFIYARPGIDAEGYFTLVSCDGVHFMQTNGAEVSVRLTSLTNVEGMEASYGLSKPPYMSEKEAREITQKLISGVDPQVASDMLFADDEQLILKPLSRTERQALGLIASGLNTVA